jgi:hypothetical protein
VDREFDNFGRYQNGTTNLSLISGNVLDLKYLDMASDITINEASYYWVLKGWIVNLTIFCRYQNGTTNLSLISGNVCSINMIDMNLRFLDMASDIRYHH